MPVANRGESAGRGKKTLTYRKGLAKNSAWDRLNSRGRKKPGHNTQNYGLQNLPSKNLPGQDA